MLLITTFNNISVKLPVSYYCWKNSEEKDLEKIIDLSQVNDKLHLPYHFSFISGPLWLWSYGNWIYSYLCNQCPSPLMLRIRIPIRVRCTTLCDKSLSLTSDSRSVVFFPGPPVFSTETDTATSGLRWIFHMHSEFSRPVMCNNAIMIISSQM
jgi:hypothetical protein